MKSRSTWISLLVLTTAVGACSSDGHGSKGSRSTGGTSGTGANGGAGGNATGGVSPNGGAGIGGLGAAGGSAGATAGGSTGSGGQGGASGGTASDASIDGHGGTASDGGTSGAPGVDAGPLTDGGPTADSEAGAGGGNLREFFYIAAPIPKAIVVGSFDTSSGVPSLLGTPIPTPQSAEAIAVDPRQTFVYVAEDGVTFGDNGHIDTYPITNGALSATRSSSVDTTGVARTIAVHPQGHFAYVGTATIDVFSIDANTDASSGVLMNTGQAFPLGVAFIAIHPNGKFLYATGGGFGVHAFSIDAVSGALNEIGAFGATGVRLGANVIGGGIVIRPSGDYLFTSGASVARAGGGFTGALNAFKINTDGTLTIDPDSPFTLEVSSDTSAPNIAVTPNGRFVYVSDFNFTRHVSGFEILKPGGALLTSVGAPATASSPYSLAVDPSGGFVFVGEDDGTTRVYPITGTGALPEPNTPFQFGGLEAKIVFATSP